jgi:carbamate kinase
MEVGNMSPRTVVVALGGNALAPPVGPVSVERQRERIRETARILGRAAERTRLVVTHGNGPQVGVLAARESSLSPEERAPLDVLTAQTEAMIGCLLQRELENALPGIEVATLLTEVLVDPSDPAFANPTKPIGTSVDEVRARALSDAVGWTFRPSESRWRRVVPSPEPIDVLELPVIRRLVMSGVVVICAGGGGIPVVVDESSGTIVGVEAVVDKDLASALLAVLLDADGLVLLTDVDAVYDAFGTAGARAVRHIDVDHLRAMALAAGSLGPKAEACCRFVEATGRTAAIGALTDAEAVLQGDCGTEVVKGPCPTVWRA